MKLRIVSGRHRGATAQRDATALVIGSGDEADLVLSDASVLREHVRLVRAQTGWRLQPEPGAPCWIQDQPIDEEAAIKPGDVLRLGDVELVWLRDPAEEAADEPAEKDRPGALDLSSAGPTKDVQDGPVESAPGTSIAPVVDAPSASTTENAASASFPAAESASRPPRTTQRRMVAVTAVMLACSLVIALADLVGASVPGAAQAAPAPAASPSSTRVLGIGRPAVLEDRMTQIAQALEAARLAHLRARPTYRGEVEIEGVVSTEEEHRLRALVTDLGTNVRLRTRSADAWRIQLVDQIDDSGVQVRHIGDARFELTGAPTKKVTESKIVKARADSGGSVEISDRLSYPDKEADAAKALPKQAFPIKLAQVAGGSMPYIQSTEGARFMQGATLPDGSIVRHIGVDAIALEKLGKTTEYRLVD